VSAVSDDDDEEVTAKYVFPLLAALILLGFILLIGETLRIFATEKERLPGANASKRKQEHRAPKLLKRVDLELYIVEVAYLYLKRLKMHIPEVSRALKLQWGQWEHYEASNEG
jgi:hypothetical protein